MDRREAHRTAKAIRESLEAVVGKDADQEVEGAAIHTLDAVFAAARSLVPHHPVVLRLSDVLSPEAIEAGQPLLVKDALIIFTALEQALHEPPPTVQDQMTSFYRNNPNR